ncbi:hypothetical protein D9Q81_06170 [Candidatus Korarchaeum cryptofilum]|uniref:Mut7-C RNAse domain-containing protein n=2 Tax=Candidatus Korarchaeum cryptofilum TaxID=498846 RepID=A0A3R9QYJ2_9CREN|nr:hypothetical protein D9Q81_06170 [Candidatus Korarchaeum cryptofilum]
MILMEFIVDSMSGKIAKWLRILGHSVKYVSPEEDDSSVLKLAGGAVLITRDHELLERARKMNLEAHEVPQDLMAAMVSISNLGIRLRIDPRGTRCPFCDEPLSIVRNREIGIELPREVIRGHRRFLLCRKCGKVFWFGSHYWKMLGTLARVKEKREEMRVGGGL